MLKRCVQLSFDMEIPLYDSDYSVFGSCYMTADEVVSRVVSVHLVEFTIVDCNGDDVYHLGPNEALANDFTPLGVFLYDFIKHNVLVRYELEALDALR